MRTYEVPEPLLHIVIATLERAEQCLLFEEFDDDVMELCGTLASKIRELADVDD